MRFMYAIASSASAVVRFQSKPRRVMIASGDKRRAGRRAQRGRVELRVAEAIVGNPIERRGWNHPAEGTWCTEPHVVGHDEQHVGRALRRDDARWPPGFRLRSIALDDATKFRRRRWKLLPVNAGGRAG